jgi:hypothetical protein
MHWIWNSLHILYSDGKGNIFEDTTLFASGAAVGMPWPFLRRNGWNYLRWLPIWTAGRRGIGIDAEDREMKLCDKGWAGCLFLLHIQAYIWQHMKRVMMRLPCLYSAILRWLDGGKILCARHPDWKDIRQENAGYDTEKLKGASKLLSISRNRLVSHFNE